MIEDESRVEELIARLGQTNQVGRVYSQVTDNLVSSFDHEMEPLELLLHSGLLKSYYNELCGYRCAKQAFTYIDLLAHETPGLRILGPEAALEPRREISSTFSNQIQTASQRMSFPAL
ncbi:hypothetical protein CP532_5122 [Ophiocordyceps camponoti-leonardi (nom. inval.)]|nr:hypothetical protein CP532_5122 [Ophiocordyceps camponoti-leonardi (nom. inval.)]